MKWKQTKNKFSGTGKAKIPIDTIDVRDLLDDLGIVYREAGHNVGSGWIGVCCNACNDSNYHLGINVISKKTSCFRCGKPGSIISFLAAELNSFTNALQVVREAIPRELRSFDAQETQSTRVSKVELPTEAIQGLSARHAGYLKSRGFDPVFLNIEYNLYHTGPVGRFPNRIIVPVVRNYRLLTYTTVSIADDVLARYKHLDNEESIIHIKDYLYNINTVKNSVFVVEGLMDCWRIGKSAVATFGTKVTEAQLLLLSKVPNVVILFDGDHAGRTAGEELAMKLAPFTDVKMIYLPEGRDPDTLSEDQIKQIRRMSL